ncbi:MAG: transporter suffix domain-containing protein [Lentimicrobiaceae bacterium]|jgi:hypothetical protein
MKKTQVLGIGLIILSWIFWGMIIVIPFLKLGIRTTSIAITILLIASNIFWLGAFLAGKELLLKYKVWFRLKQWLSKKKIS